MLRTLLVSLLFISGWSYAFQSALYAACLYLWIAYFRPESWAWTPFFASLNLSFLAGVFLLIRTAVSDVRIQVTPRNFLLILVLAHSLLATLLGFEFAYQFPYWQLFAKTLVVSFLLTVLVRTASELRLVIIVIAVSLGFEAAKQGWAQLILNPGAQNNNTIPFLGDNNLVAVGMAMLMPLLTALAATSTGWWKRGFQVLSVGIVYRGLSTYSRGGLLAFGAVGLLQLIRSPRKLRAIAGTAIVVAIVIPVLPPAYWNRMDTITASSEERDDSSQGRLHFWRVAVDMANDRPFLGVGHTGFERAYNTYDTTQGQFGFYRAVHSAWFGVLAELGYPGMAMFLTILIGSLLACRRVRKSARRGEIPVEMAAYATGLESSLVAFIVGGTFVSFHYCEMLWHVFALTMALESVALREAALARAAVPEASATTLAAEPSVEREPEFVWG